MKWEKGSVKSELAERTFAYARRVVVLCRFLAEKPGVSRTLGNQLLRSGTSIGANVEEGQPAQSEADFVSKYSITCKEARETHYWLRLLTLSFPLQTSNFILQTSNLSQALIVRIP